jgi:SAM-dependent methyltransferase
MVATRLAELRQIGDGGVEDGRGPGQLAWYRFASRFVAGKTVLDAGCGLGAGLDILARRAKAATGQDLDQRLTRPDVFIGPLSEIPSKSVDIVTSIDVVEHVEDDAGFVRELARIAREMVFLTTPNWTITRCTWPYHLREYTPLELVNLLQPAGAVRLFKGNGPGTIVHTVRHPTAYHAFNQLRIFPPTALAARCLSRILPGPARLHSHNAALVRVH